MNQLIPFPFFALAGFFIVMSFSFIYYGLRALKKKQLFGWLNRHLFAALLILLGALLTVIGFSVVGYDSLTKEQLAANIHVKKLAPQDYLISLDSKNGQIKEFEVLGDQFFIDAKIIKWYYFSNLLGFKTIYKLDRIGGRYISFEEEKSKPRSLFKLEEPASLDLFKLQEKYPILQKFVDAKYGSASFIEAKDDTNYRLMVSTTGLLIREMR